VAIAKASAKYSAKKSAHQMSDAAAVPKMHDELHAKLDEYRGKRSFDADAWITAKW
jgi:hypothetical protein